MRLSQLVAAATLAVAASAGIPSSGDGAPPSSVALVPSSSLPVATAVGVHSTSELVSTANGTVVTSSHSPLTTASPANHSTTTQTGVQSTATPDSTPHANATSSKPADATGGAILPQMQGSMAGLLGFCIMSLMLL